MVIVASIYLGFYIEVGVRVSTFLPTLTLSAPKFLLTPWLWLWHHRPGRKTWTGTVKFLYFPPFLISSFIYHYTMLLPSGMMVEPESAADAQPSPSVNIVLCTLGVVSYCFLAIESPIEHQINCVDTIIWFVIISFSNFETCRTFILSDMDTSSWSK
jgi:hypothetical protein